MTRMFPYSGVSCPWVSCGDDGDGRDHKILFDAYTEATLRPETFDAFAERLRSRTDELRSCAKVAQPKLAKLQGGLDRLLCGTSPSGPSGLLLNRLGEDQRDYRCN